MKKVTYMAGGFFAFLLMMGLVFTGCNSPTSTGEPGGETDEPETITLTDGGIYTVSSDVSYPGAEVDLTPLLEAAGKSLADISKYASVTVNAVLYSSYTDETTHTKPVKTADGDNLAQFTLLKNSGDWDGESNQCAPTKYSMSLDGDTTLVVTSSDGGIPSILLLQANWAEFPNAVTVIQVNSITFTAQTSDVVLGVIFGEPNVSVAGNTITFTGATNQSGAAYYEFPESALPLDEKTITVSYILENGFDTTLDHQLIIQAANGENDVNYDNSNQQYKDLNDPVGKPDEAIPPSQPAADGTFSGTFTIDGTALEAAALAGGFPLTRIRIVNNGGEWDEPGVRNHVREQSYSVTFNTITIH